MSPDLGETNWSGNYVYRATEIHRPTTLDELITRIAAAPRIQVLGTRHSFTGIGDSEQLVSLERLPAEISFDPDAGTVSVTGQVTYAELAAACNGAGVALANLASLPHISLAGAVATATHGSGNELGNLATAVRALELITSSGELLFIEQGDACFDGVVVGLGALGVVTRLTLAVQPYYEVAQRVYDELSWEMLFEHYEQITASGDSVSLFHRFGGQIDQVWVKRRLTASQGENAAAAELFGARRADAPRHPVLGADPVNCTAQLGAPGPWSERWPHFRSGCVPSSGEEIQSEFFVAREDATAAIAAITPLADRIQPLLLVCELRTVAQDSLWLSPQYRRQSTGIHFTWRRRQPEVQRLVAEIEARLAPFAPRPHWAKLFTARAAALAPRYERLSDFMALRDELDPRAAFSNDWLRSRVLDVAAPS